MAYSQTKYQLTHLLQDAWSRMGQLTTWTATGGSTTTVVNTAWAGVEDEIFEDDDVSMIFGSIVVVRDSAGAGAAPEGEIARITDYDSASTTATIDTVTGAVASGDKIGLASPLFPYEDMKRLANLALQRLGKIDRVDTSLTSAAGQTEYTLPFSHYPKRVRIQTVQDANDNKWVEVTNWSVIPATTGSNWTLVIPDVGANYTLELLHEDFHPKLTAYDSDIAETIAPELALTAILTEAYQWYNNKINGSNQYLLQRENKALQDLEVAKVNYPIHRLQKQITGLPHWGSRGEYIPLTSDLRA